MNGKKHVLTYPDGDTMADMADDDERIFFTQVMFHVVRCSVVINTHKRPRHEPTARVSDTAGKKNENSDAMHSTNVPRRDPASAERYGRESRQGRQRVCESWEAVDGTLYDFEPYDFSEWSEKQVRNLRDDLIEEEKQREYEKEAGEHDSDY